jgi:hypothetical protein
MIKAQVMRSVGRVRRARRHRNRPPPAAGCSLTRYRRVVRPAPARRALVLACSALTRSTLTRAEALSKEIVLAIDLCIAFDAGGAAPPPVTLV